jgi:hypothetical protein
LDPQLILPDLLALFGGSSAATDFSQIFDPGAAAAALDPSAFSADLAALFGANLAPDLTSIATSLF